ncbi:MAG: hypothetical protein EXR79_14385 [Myxococcales bacterium]|nr:hypothetical protein [Myxococcales bacterium]
MLDLARLQRIRLARHPLGQYIVANLLLSWDYRFPRRTHIEVEGTENIREDVPVVFAMNHTDRYNYWPFQYTLYRRGLGFTATWVKGKYYENALTAWFLDGTNNIPLASRGYIISNEFKRLLGHGPAEADYRWLRDLVDGARPPTATLDSAPPAARRLVAERGGGVIEGFVLWFDGVFDRLIDEVLRIHRQAVDEECMKFLVFPQGTRSKRLSQGHTGMVQVAQHLGLPIVPVGCSGSDRVYPTNSPFAQGGRIVYRIGAPLAWDGPELGPHRVTEPFRPLSKEAQRHNASFRTATDIVMAKIDGLVDEPYRYADDLRSDGVRGVNRFLH